MVGFSEGAKLRLVLRLKETGRAARRAVGYSSANSSKSLTVNRLRAGCSNDRLRESSCFPAAAASAHPGSATNRSRRGGASRPYRDEWARCDIRRHFPHKRSWSETGSDEEWRPGHHTVSPGLTGDKKSGRRGGPGEGRGRSDRYCAP